MSTDFTARLYSRNLSVKTQPSPGAERTDIQPCLLHELPETLSPLLPLRLVVKNGTKNTVEMLAEFRCRYP